MSQAVEGTVAAVGADSAALPRCALIILDEPIASLDPVGEQQNFDLLATIAREKVILFTTYRYNTIRKADTIVVLLDGRIVEIGTRKVLARHTREFWSLFLAQGSQSRFCMHSVNL